MANATKTFTAIISSQSVSAGSPLRASIALPNALGGVLTMRITNGATGPTVQCSASVLIAHDVSGTAPTAAAQGAVWKLFAGPFGGGTTANAVTEWAIEIPWGVGALEVEFNGHTVQPVTVEAAITVVSSVG